MKPISCAIPAQIHETSGLVFLPAGCSVFFSGRDFLNRDAVWKARGLVLLHEQGLGLGYQKGADGFVSWSVVPLRLTAFGHEFLEALRNSQVWNTIKTEFKDASIGKHPLSASEKSSESAATRSRRVAAL